ncbi:MAG TPA: energy transducer TonB [Paucimonas sp.]|nr:energy transducer TonB [Paucimonas sp.]
MLPVSTLAIAGENNNAPYQVTVWAQVLFDTSGKASEIDIADESSYPARFLENIRARLANARIPAPSDEGAPATFKTGVQMNFTVTPGEAGGSVRMDGLRMSPLPTKTYYASYPKDIGGTAGWQGKITAMCTVGTEGVCTSFDVKAVPGMPESVRRYAKASLERWTFVPQEVNGKPVAGEFALNLRFETTDTMPQDFREPKFDRILRGR